MVIIVLVVTMYLGYIGFEFYSLPINERFYHPQYDWFKPSGIYGHGLGIIGTILILFGVLLYIYAKKYGFLERFIRLKYLLEFHIFLCSLGPVLIVYHTSFKFGGIVSIAFWSMIAVVLSGVIGRFIYIQIPRSIEGRELTLTEIKETQILIIKKLKDFEKLGIQVELILNNNLNVDGFGFNSFVNKWKLISELNKEFRHKGISKNEGNYFINHLKQEWTISGRIRRLNQMQKLFKYWHVAHKPFALIMLVIVIIHILITVALGYKWIW
jgi:hypothetical protein